MAHWAQLDENGIVINVTVGNNDDPDEGYKWLVDNIGGTWIKTSYNTIGGKRKDPETNIITDEPGFRGNYATIGSFYDKTLDAFIPPKTYDSWILDESIYSWIPPIPYPEDGKNYIWDEEIVSWKMVQIA